MKSKIGVTIFSNGDMDILQGSIYEELWNDYCTFKKRAIRQKEKDTPKGNFLARRYERAALLALYAFFRGVLDNWIMQIIRRNNLYTEMQHADLSKKCSAVLEYCFFCSYEKKEKDISRLKIFINRYEQSDLALLEHADYQVLMEMEQQIDEYLCFVEHATSLKRFPLPEQSTSGLVHQLGKIMKAGR